MSNNLINLNTATEEELVELPGIAKGLAARIVQYREKVHPFEEVIDLASVPGISERMVSELTGLVAVSSNGNGASNMVEAAVTSLSSNGATEEADTHLAEDVQLVDDVQLDEVDVDAELPVLEAEIDAVDAEIDAVADVEIDTDVDAAIDEIPEVVRVAADGGAEIDADVEVEAEPAMATSSFASTDSSRPMATPAAATAAASDSRGIDWLAALLGAFLGLALAMLGFYFLMRPINNNQSNLTTALDNSEQRVTQIEGAINGRIDTIGADVSSLAADSDSRINSITSEITTINTEYDAILDNIEAINGSIAEAEAALVSLEDTTVALGEVDADLMAADEALGVQITELNEVTAVFDNFLVDLRNLLVNVKGVPEPEVEEEASDVDAATLDADSEGAVEDEDAAEETEDADGAETDTEGSDAGEDDSAAIINATPDPQMTPTPIIIEVSPSDEGNTDTDN